MLLYLYTELMMCLYTFLVGGGLYYLVTPGAAGQEMCTGVTCTARGIWLRSLHPQTLYIQGRWSLSFASSSVRVYLTRAGLLVPWSLAQLGAHFPMYPFGCLLAARGGKVCVVPDGRLHMTGDTSGIRLFYNICPLLLPFLTPHLLVHVEPGCIREAR